jgi:hypothetical protein
VGMGEVDSYSAMITVQLFKMKQMEETSHFNIKIKFQERTIDEDFKQAFRYRTH